MVPLKCGNFFVEFWTVVFFSVELLTGMSASRKLKKYTCCPRPYVDVTFSIHLLRRTIYHCVNLILPCLIISSMSLLAFTLPHGSGEKLTLGSVDASQTYQQIILSSLIEELIDCH